MSDATYEIVTVGKKVTRTKIEYIDEDNGPDYLLPSNGGLNPKAKSMWVEEEEIVVVDVPKPKKRLDYVAIMKKNIKGMRKIVGAGGNRTTLQDLSKHHL